MSHDPPARAVKVYRAGKFAEALASAFLFLVLILGIGYTLTILLSKAYI